MTATILPASKEVIRLAATRLADGALVVLPTDTVYGLAANALLPAAITAVYRIKERSSEKPVSLLLADPEDVHRATAEVPPAGWRLAERFWPGGLTIVFEKSPAVPDLLTAGRSGVGLRVPDHPTARAIIRALGAPVTGTSANLSGRPSARTAAEAYAQLGDLVELIVDAGACPGGIESTVIDVTVVPPRVLREGAVTIQQLRRICPEVASSVDNAGLGC